MNQLLQNVWKNKHTNIAGLVYALAKFGVPFLKIWFPNRVAQLDQTANTLEGFAVFYGLAMAGDASAKPPVGSPAQVAISETKTESTK